MTHMLDLLDPAFHTDPHPFHRAMRESGDGVHYDEQTSAWMVFRYADVHSMLRDHGRYSNQWVGRVPNQGLPERSVSAMSRSMLFKDPPEHTRLRALVNRAFTPRTITRLRPRIETLTAELLEGRASGEQIDFVKHFSVRLPIQVIAEMLGVPPGDRNQFARWSDAGTLLAAPSLPPGVREAALQGAAEFTAYLRELTAERRAKPGEDMVSALVQAEVDGETLSDNDVVAMVTLLLTAGNETTRSLLSNAIWLLLSHPDQLDVLREDPSILTGVVEEVLRFEPPVAMTFRITTQHVRFGKTVIPAGEPALAMITSANRDPREFADPDRFDLARTPNRHVGFGSGIHFCLGAPLARLEALVAIPMIFDRFPNMTLGSTPPTHQRDALTRGLASLPVVL
jgi:cytochrome P450